MDEKNREEEKLEEATPVVPMTNQMDPTVAPAPVEAAPSEVAAAAEPLDIPEGTEGPLVGEDSTVTDPEAIPGEENDQYVTATAEILIPADALNTANAMTTGDTGDGGADTAPGTVAPEVNAPEGSVVSDVTGVTADDMQPAIQESEEKETPKEEEKMEESSTEDLNAIRESLTDDDLRMILEYRKYKESNSELKEFLEDEDLHEDETGEEELPNPEPLEDEFPNPEPLTDGEELADDVEEDTPEKSLDFDSIETDDVDMAGVFDDTELDPDDLNALLGEDEELDTEALESFLGDDVDIEDVPDALRTSADFLDYILSDREDEDTEEDEVVTDEEEQEDEDEDYQEPLNFDDIADDTELEESFKSSRTKRNFSESYKGYSNRFNEAADTSMIWYPPESEPGNSEIQKSMQEAKNKATEDNIIEEYQEHVRTQRKALSDFRNKLKENRNRNAAVLNKEETSNETKFNEALKGGRNTRIVENKDSWANNTFLEKYNESSKLDFKKLLQDGFLG